MSTHVKTILCPYCGHAGKHQQRCGECGGLFEPLSKMATQIAMGPWFIRDRASPFRPGCSYEVLKKQIKSGKIKPKTILRGPTTRQFWSVARNVPGVAHLLGVCHDCGENVSPLGAKCPHCSAVFKEVGNRNNLGLRYATDEQSIAAKKMLDREIAMVADRAAPDTKAADDAAPDISEKAIEHLPPGDLLDSILIRPGGSGEPKTELLPSTIRKMGNDPAEDELHDDEHIDPEEVKGGTVLDFTPSDDDGQTPTRDNVAVAVAAPKGIGALTWVLLALVAIGFIAIIYLLVVLNRDQQPRPHQTTSSTVSAAESHEIE